MLVVVTVAADPYRQTVNVTASAAGEAGGVVSVNDPRRSGHVVCRLRPPCVSPRVIRTRVTALKVERCYAVYGYEPHNEKTA